MSERSPPSFGKPRRLGLALIALMRMNAHEPLATMQTTDKSFGKEVMPFMRKARSGHVISISSVDGLVGQPFNGIYCAAKFAVEGYTKSIACYVTPNYGINFTCVEPGEFSPNLLPAS